MANDLRKQQVRTQVRRNLRLETRTAILGDANGVVHEPGRPGWVRIRYSASANNTSALSWPTVVRFDRNVDDAPGKAVVIGYDEEGDLAVIKLSARVAEVNGSSPLGNAGNNNTVNGVVDLNNSPILRSAPFGTGAPLYVSVLPFIYIKYRTVHRFDGVDGGINLSASIPGSANQHLLAGIFLKTDNTTEVVVSTAQDITEPLDETDIQECVTASSSGAIPVCMWILRNGQTSIADTDKFWDARQWINISEDISATVTTTDATVTTLASIAITELQMATVTATLNGRKSDYSAAIGGTLNAVVRRVTGGNVTLVGSATVDIHEDSGGSPVFTLDVDTGTQTARIRVTGIVAETWYWTVSYKVLFS